MIPNSLTPEEFEAVLLDVRKAYRLLYLYQDRMLNTVRFIGGQLGSVYQGGYPWFSSNTPREGKGNLESWAWDWLNMYFYEFHFGDRQVDGQNISFAVVLQSDTGSAEVPATSRIDLKGFMPVETSQSRLRLIAGRNAWVHDAGESFDVTNSAVYTDLFRYEKADGSGVLLAKGYPLASFLNEAATMGVLTDFVGLCQQNGVPQLQLVHDAGGGSLSQS